MLRAVLACLLPSTVVFAQTILPAPLVPAGNPQTAAKALLGKALFWDEQLSSSHSVACGTCHIFSQGGTDPRASSAVNPGPDGIFATDDDANGSPAPSSVPWKRRNTDPRASTRPIPGSP